jgi:hypothetical protein
VANLGDRIAANDTDADAALEAVLGWITEIGLEPYPAQEEAILELAEGNHVIMATPTGSGKSLVAIAAHALHLAAGERSVYTAPIKALVAEKFFALCEVFGPDRVGMMTGDGSVNAGADIVCCTAEVLALMALRDDAETDYVGVIMDEFHYYGDRDRGMAWQVPLVTMSKARFVLLSATLGPTDAVERALADFTGRTVTVVKGSDRPVPLHFRYSTFPLLSTLHDLVGSAEAPVYAVHFTQRSATELAQGLLSTDLCDKEQKAKIKAEVKGFRFTSTFGKHIRRMVLHGVGLHHAGLLPKYRMLVEKLAQKGMFKIICGTDTLGVGINVPIRTVLFTQLCKFDGLQVGILSVREFQQIGGRAGRKGYDDSGTVVVQAPAWVIDNAMSAEKVKAGKKKKRKVKAQAPSRGYRHWNRDTFERLVNSPPEKLDPQFRINHSVVLARLRRAEDLGTDALDEIDTLIARAHVGQREEARLQADARQRLEELVASGVAEPIKTERGIRYTVYDDLQDDFSLYHALSLFLLDLVGKLDPDAPDYAMDVLSCVEAILEHPKVVLRAQVNREKGEAVAELKAAGIPYEERLEALEKVTWPKPKAEWFYGQFETWRADRPWLAGDPVRPKSIAREMVESQAAFTGYVKGLGIDRAEGVLLRYLSQVYKTLIQGVPDNAFTDDLVDVAAYLRAMIGRVDDSLVTSWEAMRAPTAEAQQPEQPADISRDFPAFRARIRAELHAVVRALSVGDYEEAAASVRLVEDHTWEPRDFERALRPFLDELGPLAWDGRGKAAWNTTLVSAGKHRWTVSQRLVAADLEVDPDEVAWSLQGIVDLTDDTCPSGPIVQIVALEE